MELLLEPLKPDEEGEAMQNEGETPPAAGQEEVLASIRRIAREEASGDGEADVLTLTPAMRLTAGRGAPAPAADEEPPLVLTRRVDAGTGAPEAGGAPAVQAGDPDTPEPTPQETPPGGPDETPTQPEETPPSSPPEAPPGPSEVPPQAPPETGDREAERKVIAAPVGAAARAQGERPTADPRAVRRAFAAKPGPVAASGLPRNRAELDAVVGEAIRAELSGPLGERISQNIRLLVEREVRRALEAKRPGKGPDDAA